MIENKDKFDCCGCTACASVCPKDAIVMQPSAMGFFYPKVDKEKCIKCGLCENVCSFNDHYDRSLNLPEPIAYGARHKNINEVETSRSGAAFVAFSDWVLDQGGVVYGAGYKDHFVVAHKRATTKKERDEFKGSKYVQSDLRGVFRQVKLDLKNGKIVLFSGTPCQTAGLNSFIGKSLRKNLYILDIICHGVPGPFLWRDYVTYLEKKQGDIIIGVNFRDKRCFGWNAHHETFLFSKSKKWFSFTYLFYKSIMFRPSCGACHYTNTKRPSDVTIADFWGWEKSAPEFNKDDKGVSLILCNTEKGKQIFDFVRDEMNTFQTSLENCLQPNLRCPSIVNTSKSMAFERDYIRHGFLYVAKKYGELGIQYKIEYIKEKIRHYLKDLFK